MGRVRDVEFPPVDISKCSGTGPPLTLTESGEKQVHLFPQRSPELVTAPVSPPVPNEKGDRHLRTKRRSPGLAKAALGMSARLAPLPMARRTEFDAAVI